VNTSEKFSFKVEGTTCGSFFFSWKYISLFRKKYILSRTSYNISLDKIVFVSMLSLL